LLLGLGCEILDKISVAVIGATGAVGQRFIQLLDGHPWFSLNVVAASGKSEGKKYKDIVKWGLTEEMPEYVCDKTLMPIDSRVLKKEGVELVFSALPADIAKKIEIDLASDGFYVFSNASAYRMARNVPILIADINPEHLALIKNQKKVREGYIVTNPNCSVAGLATGLKPINNQFGIKSVSVTTYQALSGAGYPGVPAMDTTGNILPFINGEEEKVELECKKILGKLTDDGIELLDFDVLASCARVPVRDGHLEAVVVDLDQDATTDEIKKAFGDYSAPQVGDLPTAPQKPIIVTDDEARPQPLLDCYNGSPERAKGMAITVGRVKKDKNKLRFYLLVHNTIRGAAGCSIMNAELARSEDYL
jgi:aspartate-semialdehyde dehydrogenase